MKEWGNLSTGILVLGEGGQTKLIFIQKDIHFILSILILGGITGAMEISITYPTEYVKTVMQLYPEKNAMGV
jgi:hypothetical protein